MALEDKARGQRIAALRQRKRLTQQVMADKLNIAYRTYQTWEAGQVMPEWPNLEALATFHGVKPEDIIGDSPDLNALLGESGKADHERLERLETAIAELLAMQAGSAIQQAQLIEAVQQLQRSVEAQSKGKRNRPGS